MDHEQLKRKKSLDASFFKGLCGCSMTGLTQEYFTPFILYLGASAFQVGFLNSAANLAASLVQLLSAEITQWLGSRRKMVMLMVTLQAVVLACMTIFTYSGNPHYGIFIFLVVLFVSFGNIFVPAWSSYLSDLVGSENRGAYFGWRSSNLGLVTVAAMGLAGFIIEEAGKINTAIGFMIIFALALCFRSASLFFLAKMYEPPLEFKKDDQFSFIEFFLRLKESNFAKFVIFVSLMNFSVNLAAPFFAVLMLRDLSFNYFLYSLIIITAPLSLYLNIRRWGKHADKVGSLKIIRLTSRLIVLLPLFWIINRSPAYLICVEVFSGFLWAGFNLCTVNFTFDAVSPAKRTRCLAYLSVVNGLALSLGALCGGAMINKLPPLFGYKILTLFVISSACRFFVSFFLVKMVKEVRKTDHIKSADLFFSMIGVKPILGIDRRQSERM